MPITEHAPTIPMSPYGSSKLMSEIMLHDVAAAYGLRYAILRYFNVAGADPQQRTGPLTAGATHLVKVAIETALGQRAKLDVLRNQLSDAGRHLHPRLHPCQRSGARAFDVAFASAPRRPQRHFQLRIWSRLFRARRDRGGETRERAQFRGRHAAAPARRSWPIVADISDPAALGWTPRFDDLDTIVAHALAFERNGTSDGGNAPVRPDLTSQGLLSLNYPARTGMEWTFASHP